MRYVGGKFKLAAKLSEYILANTIGHREHYLEPFLGSAAVFEKMGPHFAHCQVGDMHEDLILMWQATAAGWDPKELDIAVTPEFYALLRRAAPSPLRGWAAFGLSFCGKEWGGFAKADAKRNPQSEARNSVSRAGNLLRSIKDLEIRHCSYDDWQSPKPGTVVYCDPPYAGTLGYAGTPTFDHVQFWRTMDDWVDQGALVYVSEYVAPPHWEMVFSVERNLEMSGYNDSQGTNKGSKTRVERLFTRDA